MLIALFFLLIIKILLEKTSDIRRIKLIPLVLLLYLSISMIDMWWLFSIESLPFHPSDPSNYYYENVKLTLREIFQNSSSNIFYPVLNWFLSRFWDDPYWFSFWIKIDNCFLAVLIFLLMTHKNKSLSHIDYLIIFNPYLILTMNRNVRDLYIILFLLIILIGIKSIKDLSVPKSLFYGAIILLACTRAILLGLLIVVWIIRKWPFLSKRYRLISGFILGFISIFCLEFMVRETMNQMISALDFTGQDYEDLLPLLSGTYSISTIFSFLKRFILALAVFILTPNPLNFYHSWLMEQGPTGAMDIYTGFDNILIICGSLFYYLLILPYLIYSIFNLKKFNRTFLLFSFLFSVLYAISYLGQTDIRNHNTFIYFFLASIMFAPQTIRLKIKDTIGAILLCIGINKLSVK